MRSEQLYPDPCQNLGETTKVKAIKNMSFSRSLASKNTVCLPKHVLLLKRVHPSFRQLPCPRSWVYLFTISTFLWAAAIVVIIFKDILFKLSAAW